MKLESGAWYTTAIRYHAFKVFLGPDGFYHDFLGVHKWDAEGRYYGKPGGHIYDLVMRVNKPTVHKSEKKG
jgi:hypothetical protein